MRIEPVGMDADGFTYWNFNDERLYKEKLSEPVSTNEHSK